MAGMKDEDEVEIEISGTEKRNMKICHKHD